MGHGALGWMVSFATLVTGGLLAAGSTRLLGRVRAAAHWPTAPPIRRGSRAAARIGIVLGLVLLAGGVAGAILRLMRPGDMLGFIVPAAAAAVVVLAGSLLVAKLAERAELTTLIRTSPVSPGVSGRPLPPVVPEGTRGPAASAGQGEEDPLVPAGGRPGWVYRDPGGDWYLAVAVDARCQAGAVRGTAQRLVRLPDFALVPAGSLAAPLELAGSVQISVYPVEELPRSA